MLVDYAAEDYGIWWYIIWACLWSLIVACGRGLAGFELLTQPVPAHVDSFCLRGPVLAIVVMPAIAVPVMQ